ncbi:fasciclin domain-containing protein [Colwellia sp. D2M02]|uniref:fasciclin domain-containing protein n=1 Tax=Colwellia sp. D2M02 TaxID=2841562 RepID=UPI001C085383|nr:fasciclin domain-containing protein [Colwellia sp. D2M02]
MKNFKTLCITIASLFLLQACNDDDNNNSTPPEQPVAVTIVDAAVANGNFTTLVAALQATGLDATLADKNAKFTVFAPTDDAFDLLGEEAVTALLADTDRLSDILTYHVISGEVDAATAIASAGQLVEMVNGDSVGLSLDGDMLLVNTATVTITDLTTDNGIIHVIDAVLMPPAEMGTPTSNIVETAVAAGNFTTLVTALQAANLDTVLADTSKKFTVFAPTDAAFAMIDEKTLAAIIADQEVLTNILLQHVIADAEVDSVTAYSLNGTMVETASGANITIDINSETDMLTFGGVNIVTKDIYTTNGIIHVIDAVIVADVELPTVPMSLVDVAVENGNFTTLVTALQATGLDTVLADLDTDYTVFAPSDAAFAKLPEGTVAALLNDTDTLSNILLYHVVPGKVMSDAAVAIASSDNNQVVTANSAQVALSFTDGMLFVNGAKVSAADVMADNGIIHVVDNVILPPTAKGTPTDSIVDIAVANTNLSTLVDALTTADLVTTLADETATFTVFAPTNDAFAKLDPAVLNALLADTDALTSVLLKHVVSDVEINSVAAYGANGTMLTTAAGDMISVGINAETGMLMIGDTNVIMTDIYATNGVIHIIDTVIAE